MTDIMAKITIPEAISFADLKLTREADGDVAFDTSIISRVCEASGIDPAVFFNASEDNVAGLIMTWYRAHLGQGGAPDPVAEDLIGEVRAEDERGQHASHKPGRA